MYSLTALEGALLALVICTTATVLVLGVRRFFPRAMQAVTAGVDCPLIRQRATAELARDEWTRRFVDVTCCSVLGTPGVALCRKACLLAVARSPRFTRS
jgi:hypothetical protein